MIALMPRPRLLLVVVLGLLALAPAASAASRNQILNDCEDDSKLSGTYTPGELRDARNNIPSDRDAYSDCRDVLSAALAASARRGTDGTASGFGTGSGAGTTGGGGSGAAAAPSPDGATAGGYLSTAPSAGPPVVSADEQKVLHAARERLPEVDVHGQRVVPGVHGVAGEAATATIPDVPDGHPRRPGRRPGRRGNRPPPPACRRSPVRLAPPPAAWARSRGAGPSPFRSCRRTRSSAWASGSC